MRALFDAGKNVECHLPKGVSEQGGNCVTYLLKLLPFAAPEDEPIMKRLQARRFPNRYPPVQTRDEPTR
jgi:hypothetical protein